MRYWKYVFGQLSIVCLMVFAAATLTRASDSTLVPLQPQLDERAAGFKQRASPEILSLYEGAIDELRESGILDLALNVGDTVANFALPNATGDTVSLASLVSDGPAVVTWYR